MKTSVRLDAGPAILGVRDDFIAFLLVPLAVAAALFALYSVMHVPLTVVSPIAVFLLFVPFDYFHVYMGIGTAVGFPKHVENRKLFYLGFPLLCFGLYSLFCAVNPALFYSVYAYASVFHFARQQIGWIRIAGRRGCSFTKYEYSLNDCAIYASTLGFVAYRVSLGEGAQWFVAGDLGHSTLLPAGFILAAIALVNVLYVALQIRYWFRHRYFNVTKNLVWASTLMVWGAAFGVSRDYNVVAMSLVIVHHAAPFIILSSLYVKKRVSEGLPNIWARDGSKAFLFIAAFAMSAAVFEHASLEGWGPLSVVSDLSFLEPLLATVATFHYAIDSFFWRDRFNPGSVSFRSLPPAAPSVTGEPLSKVS